MLGDGDRRAFFRDTLGRAARALAEHAEQRVVTQHYFRPPGAVAEVAFLTLCTRCGECERVCPPQALVPLPPSAGLAAGTPTFDPKVQPCTVCDDIPCARACPTGALVVPFNGWDGYRMATLTLVSETCIVFHGVACGVCARVCPVGDEALSLDDEGRPVIKMEGCVGCGVCVRACVSSPRSLILEPLET
jgi:ferredoxin-type protein NapG